MVTPATQNNAQPKLTHFLFNANSKQKTAAENAKPPVASQGRIHIPPIIPAPEKAPPEKPI